MQSTATRQLERLIFDYTFINVGSWKTRFKIFDLNASRTNKDVYPKQRYDRSCWFHIHATATFEHAWATTRHTVIGGS